jgi:hypothetical protein
MQLLAPSTLLTSSHGIHVASGHSKRPIVSPLQPLVQLLQEALLVEPGSEYGADVGHTVHTTVPDAAP